jgi:hypothetical protein
VEGIGGGGHIFLDLGRRSRPGLALGQSTRRIHEWRGNAAGCGEGQLGRLKKRTFLAALEQGASVTTAAARAGAA